MIAKVMIYGALHGENRLSNSPWYLINDNNNNNNPDRISYLYRTQQDDPCIEQSERKCVTSIFFISF